MSDKKRREPLPIARLRRLGMTQKMFADYVASREEHCCAATINIALNNWHEASPRTVRIIEGALDELERRRRIK